MADLFTISSDIRDLAANAIDTMIDQLGKDCMLIFDTSQIQCPNCYFDEVRKASSGVYNGSGPVPFTDPPCPVCHGRGYIQQESNTVVRRYLIDWQPKTWNFVDSTGTRLPQGAVQTKGYIADLPLILQAKYLIVDYKNANFENNRFTLWGEPTQTGNIVPNRYFTALWVRSG